MRSSQRLKKIETLGLTDCWFLCWVVWDLIYTRQANLCQARKNQLKIWSSEDDQDSKTGRPQAFVVVLMAISFAEQKRNREN